MANFTRENPGGWALGALLTPDQINAIDEKITHAPNFDAGSSHTPAAAIVIGGAGLEVTGPATLSGATLLSGATVADDLTLSGTTVLKFEDPHPIVKQIPLNGGSAADTDVGTYWSRGNKTNPGILINIADEAVYGWQVPIDLPHGSIMTALTIGHTTGGAHAAFPGGKPATMPRIRAFKTGAFTATELSGAAAPADGIDASATAGAFDAYHGITLTLAAPETIDNYLYTYWVVILSESGANYVAQGKFCNLTVVATIAQTPDF